MSAVRASRGRGLAFFSVFQLNPGVRLVAELCGELF